jgi:pimeloyl-ACP methyl ester carboxylesterase
MTGFTNMAEEDICSIKAPVLIISGDKDVVRPEHAVEMYRLFPHGRLAIIPGGHGGYMGEIETLRVDNNSTTAFTASLIDRFLDIP